MSLNAFWRIRNKQTINEIKIDYVTMTLQSLFEIPNLLKQRINISAAETKKSVDTFNVASESDGLLMNRCTHTPRTALGHSKQ